MKWMKFLQLFAVILLSGCSSAVLLHPQGTVGADEKFLILLAAALMLIVVLPAFFMTFFFAWRYRATNKQAKHTPNIGSSKTIEAVIWLIPSLIIIVLSVLTWIYSHSLDPYKPLKSANKPLVIQVVSLDWKWLFIYPEQQIATVNLLVIPTNTPIQFYLTSATVINSFFIPQLGSQIMTMAGMQTQLHLIANQPGTYAGISANFSGTGFNGMNFKAVASSPTDFHEWVTSIKHAPAALNVTTYMNLAKPSSNNAVEYFSSVQPQLFASIIHGHEQVANKATTQE